MKSIVVLISGNGTNLQAIIDACSNGYIPGKVKAVIANKADAYGLIRANEAGIDTAALSHVGAASRESYDLDLIQCIEQYQPDLVILAGFMRILTPAFVKHFNGRLLNIHPSLMPKYPGLHTHKRAIEAKDTEHGCSVHFVTDQLDGGPVVLQAKVPVFTDDDIASLAERVHEQEHRIYPLVIRWFCQNRLQQRADQAWLDGNLLTTHGYANDED